MSVEFFVAGIPRAKGSLRANPIPKRGGGWLTDKSGRPVVGVRHDSDGLVEWQDQVARQARLSWTEPRTIGAVILRLWFILPRPVSEWSTRKDGGLRSSATIEHTRKPDLDKLERAVFDALTGVVYVDDAQIVLATSGKTFQGTREEETGVLVNIRMASEVNPSVLVSKCAG